MQLQGPQRLPVPQELRNGGEEVVIADTVPLQRERKVAEEGQRAQVFPELRRRVAVEDALQAERLELVPVLEDVCEGTGFRDKEAEEVEMREVPDRERLRRERPMLVLEVDRANGRLILQEELCHLCLTASC